MSHTVQRVYCMQTLHFGHKIMFPETSLYRPDVALAQVGGPVAVAWTCMEASHSLNVLYDVYGSSAC